MQRRYASCVLLGVLKSTLACAVPLVLATAVLAPGRAEACGGLPTPAYTIGAVSPGAVASAVARNVGIIVTVHAKQLVDGRDRKQLE
jgi:hypothetical protein